MFLRRFLGLAMLICLPGAYTQVVAQKTEPVVIKVTETKKYSSDFDEFIVGRTFIPLETNPECIMPGHTGRVILYKDLIIIQYGGQEGIYIFTREGRFRKFINPIGPGPNECRSIRSIDIYNDEIYLYDFKGGKILVVDLDGNPLRTINTPLYPYDIIHNSNGDILMYQQKELFEGKPSDIVGYNEQESRFYNYMPAGHIKQSRFLPARVFFNTINGPVMAVTACDTIYSINNDKSEPAYVLDFGKSGLTDEQKKTFAMMDMRAYGKPAMTLWMGWQQAGDMVSFLYQTDKRTDNLLFYDLERKKFYGGKWDYPDFELGRIYYPGGTTSDSYLFLIQALTIIEEAEQHPGRCSNELKAVAKTLKEDDNPVLMMWRVKGSQPNRQ